MDNTIFSLTPGGSCYRRRAQTKAGDEPLMLLALTTWITVVIKLVGKLRFYTRIHAARCWAIRGGSVGRAAQWCPATARANYDHPRRVTRRAPCVIGVIESRPADWRITSAQWRTAPHRTARTARPNSVAGRPHYTCCCTVCVRLASPSCHHHHHQQQQQQQQHVATVEQSIILSNMFYAQHVIPQCLYQYQYHQYQ